MGLIARAVGLGQAAEAIGDAVEGVSGVFLPHATRALELDSAIHRATLETAAAEFQHAGLGRFDRAINGLNRLPRPLLALGTLGLFIFAMVDPAGFATRMAGLDAVPEPLWWLLGAIVSFYFGARELHHFRCGGAGAGAGALGRSARAPVRQAPADDPVAINPALSAWRAGRDHSPRSDGAAPPRSQ
jgi:hypothetical protein